MTPVAEAEATSVHRWAHTDQQDPRSQDRRCPWMMSGNWRPTGEPATILRSA